MEPQLKQRVVGAAVMVALAVIFIPTFLDHGPAAPEVTPPPNLAPMPRDDASSASLPIDPIVDGDITSGLTATPDELAARAGSRAKVAPTVPTIARETERPQVGVATTATVVNSPAPAAPPPASKLAALPAVPNKAAPPAATGAWVVQLGSFASEDNAKGLLAKLRKAGFAGFIAPLRTASKPSFRVWVGPTHERTDAERLHTRVHQQLGYSGMVVRNE
ncbi:MAG: SPOR domain-containing protein [Gammaproteobacteria bacterium]|nr:SPOR domain-containing protein [Gammaproteobacteria bacterium]